MLSKVFPVGYRSADDSWHNRIASSTISPTFKDSLVCFFFVFLSFSPHPNSVGSLSNSWQWNHSSRTSRDTTAVRYIWRNTGIIVKPNHFTEQSHFVLTFVDRTCVTMGKKYKQYVCFNYSSNDLNNKESLNFSSQIKRLDEFPDSPRWSSILIKLAAEGHKGHVHGESHIEGGQIRNSKEELARDTCSGPRGVVQCPRLSPFHYV